MDRIYEQIAEIGKKFEVSKIVLFGSRARGKHGEKSDIDLAVYGCKDFGDFTEAIETQVWTLLSFDLIDMNTNISSELQKEIERDGVLIYEKV